MSRRQVHIPVAKPDQKAFIFRWDGPLEVEFPLKKVAEKDAEPAFAALELNQRLKQWQ